MCEKEEIKIENEEISEEIIEEEIIEEAEDTAEEVESKIIEKVVSKEDYDNLNDSYLRLRADFDNFRKRVAKEREETIVYANMKMFEKLLPVLDNFERALQTEITESKDFYDGVKMVSNQLNEILQNEGLEKISDIGEIFDPNVHYGVAVDNNKDAKDDEIVEVFQCGYKYKEKVIRPSMVKVNKL